jgi:hypothetical protein
VLSVQVWLVTLAVQVQATVVAVVAVALPQSVLTRQVITVVLVVTEQTFRLL